MVYFQPQDLQLRSLIGPYIFQSTAKPSLFGPKDILWVDDKINLGYIWNSGDTHIYIYLSTPRRKQPSLFGNNS